MEKIRNFFRNEVTETVLVFLLMIVITFGIISLMRITDKKRCEKNGGVYIWEYNYGSKCHFKGE